MTIAVEFKNVIKKFKNATLNAVDDVSLTINDGEIITILGTSGCGKTTLLKMVNRLHEFDSGDILFYGESIKNMDEVLLRRKIGYVIQDVGLFPHMNIENNIATVPKILKYENEEISKIVDDLLNIINLDPSIYKKRFPHELSGGQKQRVGLARALAGNPQLMLLDEPFGAIDAINRRNLQDELLKIHEKFKKTFLFVTHDISEAFKLGTKVIIMDKGKIQQFDTPLNIQKNPSNEFVESLLSSQNKS